MKQCNYYSPLDTTTTRSKTQELKAPEGCQKTKDATTSSSEEEAQTPPGGTTKKRRNYQGDEIIDDYDAGFKILSIKDPLLKNETPTPASSTQTDGKVPDPTRTNVPASTHEPHPSTQLNSTPEKGRRKRLNLPLLTLLRLGHPSHLLKAMSNNCLRMRKKKRSR